MQDTKLIIKRINKWKDPFWVKQYFLKRKAIFYKSSSPLSSVKIQILKDYCDARTNSFVARFKINCGKEKFDFIGAAHSDGSKLKDFRNLMLVWQNDFSCGNFIVPRPVTYIPYHRIEFYEYQRGETLHDRIKHKGLKAKQDLTQAVQWLIKLQGISAAKGQFLNSDPDLKPLKTNLVILQKKAPAEAKFLKQIFLFWKKENKKQRFFKLVIAHGDFNPFNILLWQKKVSVIDLGRMHLASPLWDIASLRSQLWTLESFHRNQTEIKIMADHLLKEYEKRTKILNLKEYQELCLNELYFELLAVSHFLVWGAKTPVMSRHIRDLKQRTKILLKQYNSKVYE